MPVEFTLETAKAQTMQFRRRFLIQNPPSTLQENPEEISLDL